MISKIVNKLEYKLTPLLLTLVPFSMMLIYLKLNNILNDTNLFVASLNFITIFMTSLIILFKTIISLQHLTNPKLPNYNLKFIKYITWVIASLGIEYITTIPQLTTPIILANGIVLIYTFIVINQYLKLNSD